MLESVSRSSPPILIVHGNQDTTVPLAQSKALQARYAAEGVNAELRIVAGGNHLFRGAARQDIDEALEATFAFLEQQLTSR